MTTPAAFRLSPTILDLLNPVVNKMKCLAIGKKHVTRSEESKSPLIRITNWREGPARPLRGCTGARYTIFGLPDLRPSKTNDITIKNIFKTKIW